MVLEKNDTIGIIALAGACNKDSVLLAQKNLESMGYKVKTSANIFKQETYLAGNDSEKIEELHKFFLDKDIKLILNARGGYGTIRLINSIDYNVIKNNPKPFCGFSDITALLIMIYKKTGCTTFHAPMACSDFGLNHKINDYTWDNFINAINQKSLTFYGESSYFGGNASGVLWGGNLSTIVSLCGQDFLPDTDFIFFTEDLNEPVYKIDKMFQQLLNIDKFKKHCKAIVLGDFLGVDNEDWLDKYFTKLANRYSIATTKGFKITHNTEKITLPIGKHCKLEGLKLCVLKK